jgi:RNA recognition motif-containing protein
MGNKLYVGNLPYTATEHELQVAFEEYGEVVSVKIIVDYETGRSKGFGFVEMSTELEAQAARTGLHGADFGGRALVVDEARPRTLG